MEKENETKSLSDFYTINNKYIQTLQTNQSEHKNLNEILNTRLTQCHDRYCQNIQISYVNDIYKGLQEYFEDHPNLKGVNVPYSNLIVYGDKVHNTTIQHELTHVMSENKMKDSMI